MYPPTPAPPRPANTKNEVGNSGEHGGGLGITTTKSFDKAAKGHFDAFG